MQIVRADVLGMCFGVRDALAFTEAVEHPESVTIHGELVHNEKVLQRLESRGFRQRTEGHRRSLPVTETVLITAHGISRRERERLLAAGKQLLDSTCPLVTRAHDAAQRLQAEGYHVLVIGRPGHVEVQGIVEDLESYTLIPDAESVIAYPHGRLGVMCQTTTPTEQADAILSAIRRKNPHADVKFADTICHPTKEHQQALEDLLGRVEAVVVVGGKNSNNTRQLVDLCRTHGVPAFHVQGPEDVRPEWFEGIERVGLTAGTSTLAETIDAVESTLREIRVGEPSGVSRRVD
jgi:4-hydroxy-3-methylbut-2-enyl diphosphate reductase